MPESAVSGTLRAGGLVRVWWTCGGEAHAPGAATLRVGARGGGVLATPGASSLALRYRDVTKNAPRFYLGRTLA